MKLYDYDSPSPRRVRIFLAEKGLQAERIHIDLMKRENWTEDFLAKNPMHAVPVLETDDGVCISESIAICRYLEGIKPEPPLFGTTPLEKALIEMWIQRVEVNLLRPLGAIWVNDSPLTRGAIRNPIPAAAEQGRKQAATTFKIFDKALGETAYFAGDTFSAADIMALCTIDFGIKRELATFRPEHANLKRWHETVSARPSAAA